MYRSWNVVRVVKLRMECWMGHATHMGETSGLYGDLDLDAGIILQWILQKEDLTAWAGFIWLRAETGDGPF